MFSKVLTRHFEQPDLQQIQIFERLGGYQSIRKALGKHSPAEIVAMVKQSGLRGRGGAGFPTGLKWSFVPLHSGKPTYLCVNADESEPGTFKDRHIIRHDPHQLLEGTMISAFALQSNRAFIYIRGEMAREAAILNAAIHQAKEKGYLGKGIFAGDFDLEIQVCRGAGAYICGEETGLLESMEGKRGQPRTKPPFPAVSGLYECPTIINNVETIANIPHIVAHGAEWFASIGHNQKNTGPKLYGLSGHIERPGVYEFDMTITLRELIYDVGGGVLAGRPLKGAIPGGSSVPILLPEEIDVPMDFDSLAAKGTMLGSAGVIAIAEGTCMVRIAQRVAQFYAFESCGQCPPCREGTAWIHKILRRIEQGQGHPGEVDLVLEVCENMKGHTICPLSDAAALPIDSYIRKYRSEFDRHITERHCPCS